ncbi:MAG TPA: hypothetical protein VFA10_01850 [Ktedonobacteraceae bacterium]|nr:hypothetical protein [Ktedonobacteraceae bacterium]
MRSWHALDLTGEPTVPPSWPWLPPAGGSFEEGLANVVLGVDEHPRKPLTMEDYLNSRYIVAPFHLYDCCLVSNGGIAVILTSAQRARTLKQPSVYVLVMRNYNGWSSS